MESPNAGELVSPWGDVPFHINNFQTGKCTQGNEMDLLPVLPSVACEETHVWATIGFVTSASPPTTTMLRLKLASLSGRRKLHAKGRGIECTGNAPPVLCPSSCHPAQRLSFPVALTWRKKRRLPRHPRPAALQ